MIFWSFIQDVVCSKMKMLRCSGAFLSNGLLSSAILWIILPVKVRDKTTINKSQIGFLLSSFMIFLFCFTCYYFGYDVTFSYFVHVWSEIYVLLFFVPVRVVFWVIFLSYALYFLHCFSKSRNFLIIDCLLKSFILKNMFSSCSTMLTENSLFPYNVIFIFQASVRACWVWDSIFPKILSMRDSKIVT